MLVLRKIIIGAVFLFSGAVFAQQENSEPLFEKQGELIKGTFYYEDGNVKQKGTYKNGKLHGEWISYDQDGKANAIAQYTNGKKTGKWFFWSGDKLSEVDYRENEITSVNSWKNNEVLLSYE